MRWGQQFEGPDELPDKRFQLRVAGQPALVADVAIGANGGHSRVRRYAIGTGPGYPQGDLYDPATRAPALAALSSGGNLLVPGKRAPFASHHAACQAAVRGTLPATCRTLVAIVSSPRLPGIVGKTFY